MDLGLKLAIDLDCSAEQAWSEEKRVGLLNALSTPWIAFGGWDGAPLPAFWEAGTTIEIEGRLLGVVPLGPHVIDVVEVDTRARAIVTDERGGVIRRWRHRVSIEATGPTSCRYVDDIIFDAGFAGPLIWPLAWLFYRFRHRRRRWPSHQAFANTPPRGRRD